jgi:hypothetical protein
MLSANLRSRPLREKCSIAAPMTSMFTVATTKPSDMLLISASTVWSFSNSTKRRLSSVSTDQLIAGVQKGCSDTSTSPISGSTAVRTR